ncbi:MAG: FKBP-type peptidyl-prolyl cis-trans isomerase [Actinobacteria bacterium]|nr:FKBP-type peptidyl-prolyl cis-trans isomerase [Actinomycetota bacterium]
MTSPTSRPLRSSRGVRRFRPRRSHTVAALVAATSLLLGACGSEEDNSTTTVTDGWANPDAGKADGAPTITAPEGDAPTELVSVDLEEGDGDGVESGDYAVVDYIGALFDDGKVFDASYGKKPFVVQVGAGQVIPGWDAGLLGMKVGGQRQLVIPADQAYGSQARGPIPADAPLIFIVELRAVLQPPTDIAPVEGGAPTAVTVNDEIAGDGNEAVEGSSVQFHYVVADGSTGAELSSSWQQGSLVTLAIGGGQAAEGWDDALLGVKPGTRRRVETPSALLFNPAQGQTLPAESIVVVIDVVAVD